MLQFCIEHSEWKIKISIVLKYFVKMHLMYYTDEKGKRVYTLKVCNR